MFHASQYISCLRVFNTGVYLLKTSVLYCFPARKSSRSNLVLHELQMGEGFAERHLPVRIVGRAVIPRGIDTRFPGQEFCSEKRMIGLFETDVGRFGPRCPIDPTILGPLVERCRSGGMHFVFADGSVYMIALTIDPETHRRLGNRQDGLPVGAGKK